MTQGKETSVGIKLVADLRNYNKNLTQAQKQNRRFKQNVKTEMNQVNGAFRDLMRGDITALPRFFKAATTSAGGFSKGLHGVKAALISTGIGAILVGIGLAIGALTQYFKGTEEGQIVFKKVMNNVKAYVEPVLQMFGRFGKALVQLFKGEFGAAWETAKGAIKGVNDQIQANRGEVDKLNAAEEKYIKLKRANLVENKRLEAEINEARRIANDEDNYSAAQRANAIANAIAKQKQLAANKKAELDLETQIAETKASFGDNDIATNDELANLKARQYEIVSEQERAIKRMGEDQQRINRELSAEITAREKLAERMSTQEETKSLKTIESKTVSTDLNTGELDTGSLENMGGWLDENAERTQRFKEQLLDLNETQSAVVNGVSGGFEMLANNIIGSLGLASSGFEGFVAKLGGLVIKMISMMLGQALAQSIAGATASGVATGPLAIFTTPAFIAEAIGTVFAAFAAIPKFAEGGIVPGSSFYGDKVLARLNSGEEVLTRNDPRHSNNLGGQGSEPSYLPADVRIMDDHIGISYERFLARRRKRIGK